MVQAIKSKTHARKTQSRAAPASAQRAVKTGKSKTAAKSAPASSHSHKKLKSREPKITATLGKIAKEHNLEDAIKSAMIAMIEKIKF